MWDWINKKIRKRKENAMESALTEVNNELEALRRKQENFEKRIRDADAEIMRLPAEDAEALARENTERDFLRRQVKVIKASITVLRDEAQSLRTAQNAQPVLRALKKAGRAKNNYF